MKNVILSLELNMLFFYNFFVSLYIYLFMIRYLFSNILFNLEQFGVPYLKVSGFISFI